jgi:ATP-dependent Lon protease
VQILELKTELQAKVKSDIEQQQKEFLLHQQLKNNPERTGRKPRRKEIEEFRKKAAMKKWQEETGKLLRKN